MVNLPVYVLDSKGKLTQTAYSLRWNPDTDTREERQPLYAAAGAGLLALPLAFLVPGGFLSMIIYPLAALGATALLGLAMKEKAGVAGGVLRTTPTGQPYIASDVPGAEKLQEFLVFDDMWLPGMPREERVTGLVPVTNQGPGTLLPELIPWSLKGIGKAKINLGSVPVVKGSALEAGILAAANWPATAEQPTDWRTTDLTGLGIGFLPVLTKRGVLLYSPTGEVVDSASISDASGHTAVMVGPESTGSSLGVVRAGPMSAAGLFWDFKKLSTMTDADRVQLEDVRMATMGRSFTFTNGT